MVALSWVAGASERAMRCVSPDPKTSGFRCDLPRLTSRSLDVRAASKRTAAARESGVLAERISNLLYPRQVGVLRYAPMDAPAPMGHPAASPKPPLTKRQASAAVTRERLIEAAIECMANYGPAGASVERITRSAGVSRGLVGHHFGGKQRLLLEAFQRLAEEMRAAFGGEDPSTEPDPVGALRTAIGNEFEGTVASPTRARAWFGFWQAALGDPELRQVNEKLYAEERERYSGLFRAAALQRGLHLDHRQAGTALVALVDGAWNELTLEGAGFGLDDAYALCDHYIEMVLRQDRVSNAT
jgi:AcrR family transcriptional regulator